MASKTRAPKIVGSADKTREMFAQLASAPVNAEVVKKKSLHTLISSHNKSEQQGRKLLGLKLHTPSD